MMSALLFAAGTAIIIFAVGERRAVRADALHTPSPLLLIDAGHGGLDGGAVSPDGTKESSINLAVAQKFFDLCRFIGIPCAMTRHDELLEYPSDAASIREKKLWDQTQRLEMINGAENAVLISIHQNHYPDPRPHGTQVLYAGTNGSQAFAELTHENLRRLLSPENRRVAIPAPNELFLLKNVRCPAILVECGFLSNPAEAEKLASAEYQTQIAAVLCVSYLQFISPLC